MARAVGRGDLALARMRATNGMVIGLAFGLVFFAAVFAALGPIVSLLGATGEIHAMTVHFLRLVMPGQPLLIIGIVGAAILRAHGDARRAMMVTVWGAVALAVLDPILIFGADLGLTGAALAGFASRVMIAVMAIRPILRHHGGFDRPYRDGLRADFMPLTAIAGPAILTQLATPVGQAVVTRMVAGYGAEAVAGMTIAGRLTPVAFGVIFALSGALGPIIGQNFGAGRLDRVRRAFLDAVIFTAVVIVSISALLFLAREPIAALFHAEGMTKTLIFLFCGPLSLLFFFNGLIFISNAACNNLGAQGQSTLINWGRHTLGTILPAAWAASHWGAVGVLLGQAVGGIVFGLLAVWLALRVIARPRITA
ncbi:MAG: MATE family efflux transporter [Paracoccaceae bacterium]